MTTGTVQDKGGKEFYTIKTKSDKVFYLIVDKDKTDENVYLLTEVGENDLLNFTDTNMVTLPQNQLLQNPHCHLKQRRSQRYRNQKLRSYRKKRKNLRRKAIIPARFY